MYEPRLTVTSIWQIHTLQFAIGNNFFIRDCQVKYFRGDLTPSRLRCRQGKGVRLSYKISYLQLELYSEM
jgi:hypothetical protein